MIKTVSVADKMALIGSYWQPRIVGAVNDCYVKVARLKGSFIWHHHETEDEMFLVVKGNLIIKLRDGEIQVGEGEFVIIPRGVEHLPVADDEVQVLLLEPKTTINTGNVIGEKTVDDQWL